VSPSLPVVVARAPVPEGAYAPLEGLADLRLVGADVARPALLAGLREAVGFIAFLTDRIDGELFQAAPALRVVANYAVGVNNVDLAAARARELWITNTPGVLTDATAELAVGAMIALLRRFAEGERELRAGRFDGWTPTYLMGEGLSGKTLGIVGLGRIGRAVAARAAAFGTALVYTSRGPSPEAPAGARRLSLEALLAESDIVSLHVPLTPETRHLLDARALSQMKPTAVLVNTSRGPVVDEAALAQALGTGRLAGAALDVYEDEPRVHPALLAAPSTLLLPHLGSNTRAARLAMGRLAARTGAAVLRGERPPTPVAGPGSALVPAAP
jgi:glyoxylate reductase